MSTISIQCTATYGPNCRNYTIGSKSCTLSSFVRHTSVSRWSISIHSFRSLANKKSIFSSNIQICLAKLVEIQRHVISERTPPKVSKKMLKEAIIIFVLKLVQTQLIREYRNVYPFFIKIDIFQYCHRKKVF